MKVWMGCIAKVAMGAALITATGADAKTSNRTNRARTNAAPSLSTTARPWGILATMAGTSWLHDATGTVMLYKWKLRNEILEIQVHNKNDVEPRIDEIRLTADGTTLTRVTVAPKEQVRRFAIEMPRPGILIEAEALGATLIRRTSRLAGNSLFADSQTTLNGAVTATDTVEWRKAAAAEITAALDAVGAAQGARRLARSAMEQQWGPLARLVDNDWRYASAGATFVTQYRWRDPGKVMVASHTASRKMQSYEEVITLDAATGAISGRANGLAVTYILEDGSMVATAAGARSRTLRKLAGPASYQIVIQKRKGEDWVTAENMLAENANGGVATAPINLASVREESVIASPLKVAMPLPPERKRGTPQQQLLPLPVMIAESRQQGLRALPERQPPRIEAYASPAQPTPPRNSNGGVFGKLMGAAGGALAMGGGGDLGSMMQGAIQGASMVDNAGNLAPGATEAMMRGADIGSLGGGLLGGGGLGGGLLGGGSGNATLGLLGVLGGGGRSVRPAQQGQVAKGTASQATSPSKTTSGGSYAPRPNILAGQAACRGYTVDNYKQFFQQNSNGPDVQLHTLCAGAYNYYWMYLNAIRQGYSQSDSDRTYAAFTKSASVATDFYAQAR